MVTLGYSGCARKQGKSLAGQHAVFGALASSGWCEPEACIPQGALTAMNGSKTRSTEVLRLCGPIPQVSYWRSCTSSSSSPCLTFHNEMGQGGLCHSHGADSRCSWRRSRALASRKQIQISPPNSLEDPGVCLLPALLEQRSVSRFCLQDLKG